jgi:hypothetical protein
LSRSRWESDLVVTELPDRRVQLLAPLVFWDAWTGEDVIAPTDFVSDGTTRPDRPRWLRWLVTRLIGHPLTRAYLAASVLHDAEIAAKTASWWRVHTRYYRALRAPMDGVRVGRWRAAAMTAVVVVLGPRW